MANNENHSILNSVSENDKTFLIFPKIEISIYVIQLLIWVSI